MLAASEAVQSCDLEDVYSDRDTLSQMPGRLTGARLGHEVVLTVRPQHALRAAHQINRG